MQVKSKAINISPNSHLHLIGIGGAGMSGIAVALLQKGYRVSGSDLNETEITKRLKEAGASVHYDHKEDNIAFADAIVVSSAIPANNAELMKAIQVRSPIYQRAEILNWLMKDAKNRVVVAGTHGKSTTTMMITSILEAGEKSPSYIVGANRCGLNTNAKIDAEEYFVVEGDESDGSILCYDSNQLIVTNIEEEHMSYFKTRENLCLHFKEVLEKVIRNKGTLLLNKDDKTINELIEPEWKDSISWFSLDAHDSLRASNIRFSEKGSHFSLELNDKGTEKGKKNDKEEITLPCYGTHNIYNALAAIQYGLNQNIPLEKISKALSSFKGAKRRFEKIIEQKKIRVFDDYAHHPTEIQVTLNAAKKSLDGRLICIFQPHRFSRTKELLSEFVHSFFDADWLILSDIFSANEEEIKGVNSQSLAEEIKRAYPKLRVDHVADIADISEFLTPKLIAKDIVITMGAGNIGTLATDIATRLKQA